MMASHVKPEHRPLPGEVGVWMLVIGDMLMFTALFCVFLYYESLSPSVFRVSRHTLHQYLGLINTVLMLTSSWAVATATLAARMRRFVATKRLLLIAVCCGALFGGVKYIEWLDKISHSLTPLTNNFYMLYFALTGIHMVHVLIGIIVLLLLARTDWQDKRQSDTRLRNLESGAIFWHLVDLLWIVLFALLYLLP